MNGGVLFHVQYLLGIGHLQRSWRIAEALARRGVHVTFVSGGAPVPELVRPQPNLAIVQLPPIKALDARFALVDGGGRPIDDALRAQRRAALLDAVASARPNAVVIEGFPFARRAFRFELDPLIAVARSAAARIVCSVRDIVTIRNDPERRRAIAARVRADFDAVLVHGDPELIRFEASFPAVAEIADRLVYTGYVHDFENEKDRGKVCAGRAHDPSFSPKPIGEVLVSGGGGPAGYDLLRGAIAARRGGCLADSHWRLLAGVNLPAAQFAALAASAPAGVTVERFRSDFQTLLRRARVSVSQAGYNTALDIIAARAPAVLVPFAAERETEQLLRAQRLAALGVAELVEEAALSPATLAAAIERAASRRPPALRIDMAGAERSAMLIADLIAASRDVQAGASSGIIRQ